MKIFRLLIFVFATGAWATDRPNVIIIFTDDQGYGDLSCHGNPILEPPNFDKLHSESVRFGTSGVTKRSSYVPRSRTDPLACAARRLQGSGEDWQDLGREW